MSVSALQSNLSNNYGFREYASDKQLVSKSDAELYGIANDITSKEKKSSKKSAIALALMLPFSIFISGATSTVAKPKNFLSKKLFSGASLVGKLVSTSLLIATSFGILSALTCHSEKSKEFTKKHNILVSLGIIGGGIGICHFAEKAYSKLKSSIEANHKDLLNKIKSKKTEVAKNIDNSTFNKKIVTRGKKMFADFSKEHAFLGSVAKKMAVHAPILAFVGLLGTSIIGSKKRADKTEKTYFELKTAQTNASKRMINVLETQTTKLANVVKAEEARNQILKKQNEKLIIEKEEMYD